MKNLLLLTLIGLFCSCAASYNSINPKSLNYPAHNIQDEIRISYNYDVLGNGLNKKYAKKEYKNDIKLIAVKVTNNTDSTIVINRNAFIYSGGRELNLLSPSTLRLELGQLVPSYVLYGLLSFIQYRETTNGVVTKSFPIGVFLAVPIMVGNMIVAGTANKGFYRELMEYDLDGRTIEKGEVVTGLIGVRNFNYLPLTVKYK